MANDREAIIAGLEPLFEQAKAKSLWFYSSYQRLWFSPAELQAEHKDGKFIWGAVNWQLRAPQERVAEFERAADTLSQERDRFEARIAASQ